jgi:hypothetical protein
MRTTGETCREAGTYVATCRDGHAQEVVMLSGYVFVPCGHRMPNGDPCGKPVDWTLKPARTH